MQYAETAALVEVMDGDYGAARRRLEGFTNGELRSLAAYTETLQEMVNEILGGRTE